MFRKVEKEASPIHINTFRTLIGAISFAGLALFLGEFTKIFDLPADIWFLLVLSFLFGQVIGDTAYFKAQLELGTTIALAVSMTFPFFTFLFSIILLGSIIPLSFFISATLIGCGVILIGRSKEKTTSGISTKNRIFGDRSSRLDPRTTALLIAFIAAIFWALGGVLTEISVKSIATQLNINETSSLIANVIRFPFAILFLVPMAFRVPKTKVKDWTSRTYGWLLVASLIGTIAGAFLYTEAIRLAGASFVSLLSTASPLFALPITRFLNDEIINKKVLIGVFLTMIGVILILL
jgi:uncharacterized membrane protein